MKSRVKAGMRKIVLSGLCAVVGGMVGGVFGLAAGHGIFDPLACVYGSLAGLFLPWGAARLPSPFAGL